MENQRSTQNQSLFGAPTNAKAAGLTFTLAAIFPSVLAIVFLFCVQAFGLNEKEGYTSADWYLYANYLLVPVAFACIAALVWAWQKKPLSQTLKAQKCHYKYYIIALCLQVGLFSLSQLNTWFLELLGQFGYVADEIELPSTDGVKFVFVLLAIAVLPALFEELIFRGFLLDGLRAFGEVGAILLCGGLFALYHQNPAQTLYQFCCGAAFALVALRSGSILPTVLSHFFNNALILILYKYNVAALPAPFSVIALCVSAACLLLSLGYLIFWDKQPREQTQADKTERKRFLLFAAVGVIVCGVSWVARLFT